MRVNDRTARTSRVATVISALIGICTCLLLAARNAAAATFPARGDDIMSSMGVFRIAVSPPFRSLLDPAVGLNGYPGYQPVGGRLTSPLLIDRVTRVGRSDPYNRPLPGTTDVGVPTMGLQGYGDYPLVLSAFGSAAAGTREILTRIRDLELRTRQEGCPSNADPRVPSVPIDHRMVYAGPTQGVARKSVGMVQEKVVSGAADPDFPARSFFDIFVEVNIPAVPGTVSFGTFPAGGAILYNDVPLVITNENLTTLPPQVIYIHGETTAVPLKFRDDNPPYWNAEDVFGYLVLAGHGTQIDCSSAQAVNGFLTAVLGPLGGRPANELPIEWPFPTDNCPPPNAAYESVKLIDAIEFAGPTGLRIQGRNFSHRQLDNPIAPPALGSSATYSDATTTVALEFSLDGNSWTQAQASGGVVVRMAHTSDSGDVRMFDTEMLSLNLNGTSPFGPFMLRESPTLASRGRHTIRSTGGPYLIGSFFDVFLELSVDNGTTWMPANRAIRVQLLEPCETLPPRVVNVSPDCDQNLVAVQFSEPLDPVTATDPSQYSLGAAGSVLGAALNAAGDVVTLTTADLVCDKRYSLTVRSVEDKCGNVVAPNPTVVDFVCPPCKVVKWSQLPGFLLFPAAPQGRGADRPSDIDWVALESGPGTITPNTVVAEDFRSDGRPILCVRWWGSYLPGFEPSVTANSFFEDGYVLSFFTDLRITGAPSRPDRLLGTYVAPLSSIKITPTDFIGCDQLRIWQYELRLEDTCLDHPDPTIARPDAFLEKSNTVYWLAITAEVGHRVIPLIDSSGQVVKWQQQASGKRADRHFWGWHTSPRQREDLSVSGNLLMQGTEWIYPAERWRPNPALCNEIDQAFELLTVTPPCETDPPGIIAVAIDCDNDVITVTYNEAMDPATAGSIGNYALGGANITSVSLNATGDKATLKIDDLKCAGAYTLTVRSVTDLCGNTIVPNPTSRDLLCPPCPQPKVSKWSQLPGFLVPSTVSPQGRGGDRPSDFDWNNLVQSGTQFLAPNAVVAEDFRSDGRPILCVRWWGSYMRGFEPGAGATLSAVVPPRFFEDGYVLSFFSDFRQTGAASRPDRLMGTYMAPLSAVKITATQFYGCDSNRIWQYEVKLEDTCLEHADPGIATPRAFLERSNTVYWVAITAEVGLDVVHTTDPAGNTICREQFTGKHADRHFWGWHTSPNQREDRSVTGRVLMQSTNWVYPASLWVVNQPFCNEIDQAFELLTSQSPCETNPPTVISVIADCDSNRVTVKYSEPVDPASAAGVGTYTISGGVGITSITLNPAGDTATLTTGDLLCGRSYTITVRGVRDLCTNSISPNPQSITFVCPPCPQVKTSKWSQLPAYLLSPANPHRHGIDRRSDFDWTLLMEQGTTILQPNSVVADDFVSDGRPILCVRWWGSYTRSGYEPTAAGQYFEDAYVISFFTGFIGGINRPDKLLATYVAPVPAVKVTPTQFFGCDTNRIYQYEVALKDTCLDHRFASIARPSAFLEKSNGYYYVSIAAEVGHRVRPLRDSRSNIVDWVQEPSGKRAQEHFWGWHTSPTNRLDFGTTGNILMQGTEWLYTRWFPNNDPFCDNELAQAFELLTGPLDCPGSPALTIARDHNNVVLSWVGTGFMLQAASTIVNPTEAIEWTDIPATSPVTLPIVFTQNAFFRLICP